MTLVPVAVARSSGASVIRPRAVTVIMIFRAPSLVSGWPCRWWKGCSGSLRGATGVPGSRVQLTVGERCGLPNHQVRMLEQTRTKWEYSFSVAAVAANSDHGAPKFHQSNRTLTPPPGQTDHRSPRRAEPRSTQDQPEITGHLEHSESPGPERGRSAIPGRRYRVSWCAAEATDGPAPPVLRHRA